MYVVVRSGRPARARPAYRHHPDEGYPNRALGIDNAAMGGTRAATIDGLLARARTGLDRVHPADLAAELAAGAVVVDIRPVEQRRRDGDLPGALVVDRNVLEWRLDPTSPHRLPVAVGTAVRYVVVCNEGYSSSLAAASLRDLGLHRATDLAGGYQAWLALRRPTDAGSGAGARTGPRTGRPDEPSRAGR